VLSGICYVVHNVCALSLRQQLTPDQQLGRVNATFLLVNRSLRPLGALTAGLVASELGVREALFVGSAGIIAASAWLLLSPLPGLKDGRVKAS
jgi:hypothetical protein